MEQAAVAQISPRPYLAFQQNTTFSMQTSMSMALSLTVTMIGSMCTPTAAVKITLMGTILERSMTRGAQQVTIPVATTLVATITIRLHVDTQWKIHRFMSIKTTLG